MKINEEKKFLTIYPERVSAEIMIRSSGSYEKLLSP